MLYHDDIRKRYALLSPTLDERGRRIFAAREAMRLGHGGIVALAGITGLSRQCVAKGIKELDANETFPEGRIRKPGGGRKKQTWSPTLLKDLEALLEPDLQAEPEAPLRWTTKSLRQLARELQEKGHTACYRIVGDILRESGYSLQNSGQKNRKSLDETDRSSQFRAVNDMIKEYMASGDPVVFVDTRKKRKPVYDKNLEDDAHSRHSRNRDNASTAAAIDRTSTTDDFEKALNKGILLHGEVAAFAVFNIERWWQQDGSRAFPEARRLLITLGGCDSYRSRHHIVGNKLKRLAGKLRFPVSIRLFPPGTSRWNGVEHRFYSFVSIDWTSKTSYETVMSLLSRTVACKELPVYAIRKWLEQKERIVADMKKANRERK